MRKLSRLLVMVLILTLAAPSIMYAAPQGYMEVSITKRNFKNYLAVQKTREFDAFGDYNGYCYRLVSKLLSKGYYVYSEDGLAVKFTAIERIKYKSKKEKSKVKWTLTGFNNAISSGTGSSKYNFKYAKLSKIKVKKAKGTIVFIEPSNVISVDLIKTEGANALYRINLRFPYDSSTAKVTQYNENTGKDEIQHYYLERWAGFNNPKLFY